MLEIVIGTGKKHDPSRLENIYPGSTVKVIDPEVLFGELEPLVENRLSPPQKPATWKVEQVAEQQRRAAARLPIAAALPIIMASDVMFLRPSDGQIQSNPNRVGRRQDLTALEEEAVGWYTKEAFDAQWVAWYAVMAQDDHTEQVVHKLGWVGITASFAEPLTREEVQSSFDPGINPRIPMLELAEANGAQLAAYYPGGDTRETITFELARLLIIDKLLPAWALWALIRDEGYPLPPSEVRVSKVKGQHSNGNWLTINSIGWYRYLVESGPNGPIQ